MRCNSEIYKMLNTNSPNVEPKVKELLLERRHSISLEVSKKRRQSVASSIFIPKDYLHSEMRIKAVSESENKSVPPSRNKKRLAWSINKRRNINRVMLKKKLKRAKISNKNNNVAKFPTSPISLKHPESYPIVKQTVSSEKIRCVVESLRDSNERQNSMYSTAAKNFETSESLFKMDLFETNEFAKEQKQLHNIKPEQGKEEEREKLQQFQISSNVLPQVKENNEAGSETLVINDEAQSLNPQINYSSTNRVENFVILVDSSGAHVEIKYAGHPSPLPNENEKLEGDNTADDASLEETKRQYEDPGYFENCTSTATKKMVNSREQVENIYVNTVDISRPNSTPSNQEDIIDLSIKETAAATKSVPVVYRPSNAELIYGSTIIKGINPITQNTQSTDHGPDTYLHPEKQTRLPCRQKLLDQIRPFAKNPSSSISPACCKSHNSKERSKLSAGPHKKKLHSLNKSQVVPFHNHSFIQQGAQLETPPISPRNKQWIPIPPRINFPSYNQQYGLRSGCVTETTEIFSNTPANSMSHKLTYSPNENIVYPPTQHFQNQLLQILDDTQQLQKFNSGSFLPHNFNQLRQSHQFKQLRQHPLSQQSYNYMEQNQLAYSYQMSNHLDLPRQFYHPLHQCFLSNPNPSRSTSAPSIRTAGFEPIETWRYPSRPNMIPPPPVQSVEPDQNYLPPTPPTIDRCFPQQQLTPASFPFPSPNWTNTLYNCPSLPSKSPSCWNIPPHTYSIQPKLPSEIELLSRLKGSTFAANSMNSLTRHTHNSLWPSTHLHKQAPSHFHLNYI
ncbi:uncharacterized protein LOC128861233 isoform X1 [Anastrepha ludens]|uniref:uncharacterized protein LOC128861233 isoform X1 n=2 Tax=Anastrepha ludens TaxID=28586 RepID=UPI0023AF5853|nr:uncharacterized protein LOC128861233 isoform X1 [Anastrepha ludens]